MDIDLVFVCLVFFAIILFNDVDSLSYVSLFQCRTYMTSTCPNFEITKWNTKNVGKNLKEWIKSVSIEWKSQQHLPSGRHCKAFVVKKNSFFYQYAPDVISPNIIILGKLMHDNEVGNTKTPKLYGPVWADVNNQAEWSIIQHGQGITARLSLEAVLRNGLYYGVLNNNQMKIGNCIQLPNLFS